MWIKILLNYILGYLNVEIEGYYIERFINISKNEKVLIWNLKRKKDVTLNIKVGVNEFRKICKIARKTKCKIKINSKRGIPFILNKYRKRKIFLILLILIAFLIFLSSNFVWNVDIKEENDEELENIRQDIYNAGLNIGKFKGDINTKEIINKLRLERQDIAWMGIELKGTNAIVKIVKSTDKPDIINENEYCSIVSDKAGIITKISAQNGTANVQVGDIVNVGDVLVNGWMEGKYTGIRYVHAIGEIQAKVWYTKHKNISYKITERRETGNLEDKYSIKFNNFEINFNKNL